MIATKPAERFKLKTKGEIAVLKDADVILVDPNQSYIVKAEDFYYRHKHSPYTGKTINCRVTKTFVRGHLVFDLHQGIVGEPIGQFLPHTKTSQNNYVQA
jgi:allantoinase